MTLEQKTVRRTEDPGSRTARPEIPVEIVPTSAREHITGFMALNIPARFRMSEDWHEHSAWFWAEPVRIDPLQVTDEQVYGRLADALGKRGPERRTTRAPSVESPGRRGAGQSLGSDS